MKNEITSIRPLSNAPDIQVGGLFDYLNQKMAGKAEGEITLDKLVKDNPTIDKYEIVALLKKNNSGTFKSGRRGHSSRWTWGQSVTTPLAATPNPVKNAPTVNLGTSTGNLVQHGKGMALRISVGGMETFLPLTLDLIAA